MRLTAPPAVQEELESVETALARYTLRINELRKSLAVPSPEPGTLAAALTPPPVAQAHRPAGTRAPAVESKHDGDAEDEKDAGTSAETVADILAFGALERSQQLQK